MAGRTLSSSEDPGPLGQHQSLLISAANFGDLEVSLLLNQQSLSSAPVPETGLHCGPLSQPPS